MQNINYMHVLTSFKNFKLRSNLLRSNERKSFTSYIPQKQQKYT